MLAKYTLLDVDVATKVLLCIHHKAYMFVICAHGQFGLIIYSWHIRITIVVLSVVYQKD